VRSTRVAALARLDRALCFELALLNVTTKGAGVSEDVGPALGRPLKRAMNALPLLLVARRECAAAVLRAGCAARAV